MNTYRIETYIDGDLLFPTQWFDSVFAWRSKVDHTRWLKQKYGPQINVEYKVVDVT